MQYPWSWNCGERTASGPAGLCTAGVFRDDDFDFGVSILELDWNQIGVRLNWFLFRVCTAGVFRDDDFDLGVSILELDWNE